MAELRTLVVVLGDQLDADAAAFDGFDPEQDAVWMAEVDEESTHVWSTKARIAMFLAGMRHFAAELRRRRRPLHYLALDDPQAQPTLAAALSHSLAHLRPARVVMTAPGDWRVWQAVKQAVATHGLTLEICEDRHFYTSVREFIQYAGKRKSLRMEYFYRQQRTRHNVLMQDGQPVGGRWNFDSDNRQSFGRTGPIDLPPRQGVAPDALTRAVLALVQERFAGHPGSLDHFDWPVTREEALRALEQFIDQRLANFGRYEDALWPQQPWLYHSQLSAALNLKLLHPREVVHAAEAAYHAGEAPIESVEGFIRQILGWREYVRGIYWWQMPGYLERNALGAKLDLPDWYWTGKVDMACLSEVITQTLTYGYAHHIQRLMVTGLYALLLGVEPQQVHAWYLAVYVDAVEWVELPNTLGMSQYGDGGLLGSKPYVASGKYIEKMGGPCHTCRFRPDRREGDDACPFTTLYWDFLLRHATHLTRNPRMMLQVKNLTRLSDADRAAVRQRATQLKRGEIVAEMQS